MTNFEVLWARMDTAQAAIWNDGRPADAGMVIRRWWIWAERQPYYDDWFDSLD